MKNLVAIKYLSVKISQSMRAAEPRVLVPEICYTDGRRPKLAPFMKQYSIHPILNFIKKDPRPHYRAGDLQQMADMVARQRRQKLNTPGQEQSVGVEDEYLKIITALQTQFKGPGKITRAALLTAVNKLLTTAKLKYRRHRHARSHDNTFFGQARDHKEYLDQAALAAEKYSATDYDVAFYHPQAPYNEAAHHTRGQTAAAVFFMRMEEFGTAQDKMLVGNLQIDDTAPAHWESPTVGGIFTGAKNMDLTLVQEAVKYALAAGKKDIYFQDGDAMELAQFHELGFEEILITPKNYARYAREYYQHRQDFAQIRVGDNIAAPRQPTRLVYEKTATTMKVYNFHVGDITTLGEYLYDARNLPPPYARKDIFPLMEAIDTALRTENFPAARTALDNFWDYIAQKKLPRRYQTEKLNYLRDRPVVKPGVDAVAHYMEAYAFEFGYHKIFQAQFPEVLWLKNPRARGQEYYYIDPHAAEDIEQLNIKELRPPEVGKVYLKHKGRPEDFFSILHFGRRNNYNWYHKRVPAALKKLGLSCERVPLAAVRVDRYYPAAKFPERQAHAWRITDGLEEFKRRPLALFASHTEMKSDTVTLAELHRAAQKFNLPPAHVEVMNAYLTTPAGDRRTGAYYPARGTVQLANSSLATLAHEGLHHLATQGLIPARAYRALVAAGQQLAQRSGQETYLTQTARGHEVYPAGPDRDQEAAALFVENYYLASPRARKKLIGTRLTSLEKVLEYVVAVLDILAAGLGNQPARARAYLRRVSTGYAARYRARSSPRRRPAAAHALA